MKKDQQTYIIIGVGVAIFLFAYFKFFLMPINKKISESTKKIEELTASIESANKEAAALEELKAKNELLKLEVEELQKQLPKSKEIPGLLRTVTKDAQRFGVKVVTLAPLPVSSQSEYDELRYSMNVQSNYHSLGNFFATIGQEERLLSVRDLVLAVSQGSDKSITVAASYMLVAYMAKNK
jgi:type IV pilus assembly protein PilO